MCYLLKGKENLTAAFTSATFASSDILMHFVTTGTCFQPIQILMLQSSHFFLKCQSEYHLKLNTQSNV